MPGPAQPVWLICQSCWADFRFDESPDTEYCAECCAWKDWIAGAVVPE